MVCLGLRVGLSCKGSVNNVIIHVITEMNCSCNYIQAELDINIYQGKILYIKYIFFHFNLLKRKTKCTNKINKNKIKN